MPEELFGTIIFMGELALTKKHQIDPTYYGGIYRRHLRNLDQK